MRQFLQLPPALRAWLGLVTAGGAAAAIWASGGLIGLDPIVITWSVAGLIAAIHVVPIPGTAARLSAETPFILVLLGSGAPAEAVLLSGLSQIVGNIATGTARAQPYVVPFNAATGLLAAAVASAVMGSLPLVWPGPLLMAGLIMAVVNAGLVAIAIRAGTGEWPGSPWRRTVSVTCAAYLASAALAALFVQLPDLLGTLLLVGPLLLLVGNAYRIHGERMAEQVARQRDRVELFLPALQAMVEAIEARDANAHGRNRRVRACALGTAAKLGIRDETVLTVLDYGVLLHDVGRIAIPDSLLFADRPLTDEEEERVRRHVVIGSELIRQIPFPAGVAEIVRHHHERWDGTGYPDGLRGEQIPLCARIVAVCDAWDELRTGHGWRAPRSAVDAMAALRDQAGAAFDPKVVEALAAWLHTEGATTPEHETTPISAEISAVAREQARLSELAFRDELTGLSNARALARDLRALQTNREAFHVFVMDLDNFKGLNDHLGHDVGDEALRLVGAALTALEGPELRAYRNGGDEFTLVVRQVSDPDAVAARIRQAVETVRVPVEPSGFVVLQASVGAASCGPDDVAAQAMRRADAAMYAAKRAPTSRATRGAPPVIHRQVAS